MEQKEEGFWGFGVLGFVCVGCLRKNNKIGHSGEVTHSLRGLQLEARVLVFASAGLDRARGGWQGLLDRLR